MARSELSLKEDSQKEARGIYYRANLVVVDIIVSLKKKGWGSVLSIKNKWGKGYSTVTMVYDASQRDCRFVFVLQTNGSLRRGIEC